MRVADHITFTSPSGLVFEAQWIGGERTYSKKTAEFNYAGVNGSTIQDWGLNSAKLPLDFWFTDQFHRITAANFQAAMSEKGPWKIFHPTQGLLSAQPTEITVDDQPVKSNNVTAVKTQWIIAIPNTKQQSTALSMGSILSDIGIVSDKTGDGVNLKEPRFLESFRSTMKSIMAVLKKIIGGLTATVNTALNIVTNITDHVLDTVNKFHTALNNAFAKLKDLLAEPYIMVSAIVSAIRTIMAIPAMLYTLVREKVALYKTIGKSLRESINSMMSLKILTPASAGAYKIVSGCAVMAMCASAVSGTALSRDEALAIADSIDQENSEMMKTDDLMKMALQENLSKDSYNGDMNSESISNIVGRTINYVLSDQFSNSIKRTTTLDQDCSTLAYAMQNYPEKSPDDAYEFLIDTNGLTGDEIILMPSGKKVILYSVIS